MAKKTGVDWRKFDKFKAQVSTKHNSPELRRVYTQWGVRYLAWTKRLFIKNSNGGGEWPGLKKPRMRKRRGKKRKPAIQNKSQKILRDTGTLFKALTIKAPGNLFKIIKKGIYVGFGGPSRHKGGAATIADIAKFHHNGEGNLPERKILHQPEGKLVKQMLNDLKRAINKLGKQL